MHTEMAPVSATRPDAETLRRAARILQAGGLVAFPTETVYGLGANALAPGAVARIFAAKGRPATNPVIVHVAEVKQARDVAAHWPEAAERLAAHFWPGPLTLVLPRGESVPPIVTAGGPTVAVRIPAHPTALALLQAAGIPVAAPSANRSNQLSPTRAEHVLTSLNGRVEMILDGGPTPGGLESTVLDLTATPPRLLRPGLIAPAEVEAVVGPVARPTATAAAQAPLPSPGLLARHYAPRTPLETFTEGSWARIQEYLGQGQRVGWLTLDPNPRPDPNLLAVPMPHDPAEYAARLYAVLHELDALGLNRILVDLPPDADAWLAVRDRLRRAGTPGEG